MSMPIPITEDAFLGGKIIIEQPQNGYRAGLDPVLLASSVVAHPGEKLLDAGCGVGTALLCLEHRTNPNQNIQLVGLEMQPILVQLAQKNLIRNGIEQHCTIIEGSMDITSLKPLPLERGSFDQVFSNPPYAEDGTHTPSENLLKACSHQMHPSMTLTKWIHTTHILLKPKGMLTMILKTSQLQEALVAFSHKFGHIEAWPLVTSREHARPPKRILVRARKGTKGPLVLHQAYFIHERKGDYTPQTNAILREGEALSWPAHL